MGICLNSSVSFLHSLCSFIPRFVGNTTEGKYCEPLVGGLALGTTGLPGGMWLASVHLMEQIFEAGAVLELCWVLPVLFVLGVLILVIINYILVYNFSSNQSPSVVFFPRFHDLAQSHMCVAVLFQILKMLVM